MGHQPFLDDLCRALGTPRPADGALPHEDYQYEKIVEVPDSSKSGRIDMYKKGHFVLEAKCGRNDREEEGSAPIRGTGSYNAYIEKAYNDQARVYATLLPEGRPPVLIVVDVGHQFWIWRRGADGEYPGFHSPLTIKIPIHKVAQEENARVLWLAFTDPASLDPSRFQERVTNEIAQILAKLAKPIQQREAPEKVARFLIQTLFCMFAEDVGLLPPGKFTEILRKAQFHKDVFAPMMVQLFTTMRDGGVFDFATLKRFNGALFSEPAAIPLTTDEIMTLTEAARRNWAVVEPAIFGTLIERALDPDKRRALGAHYTPRSFVERLVKPVVEEPLRGEWELGVKPEATALWKKAEALDEQVAQLDTSVPGWRDKAGRLESEARVARRDALKMLDDFHYQLTQIKVLDPACGTGNFLYVAYDALKSLEFEVLSLRAAWAPEEEGAQALAFGASGVGAVTPSQMLGLEIEPFAAEIAQLTLWIGHLQWELRHNKDADDLPEPIIPNVRTIECRDALIQWEARTPRLDDEGQPVTRWKVGAMKPATTHDGLVPDETVREPVFDYDGVTRAPWPKADFIVGNPPFIGNKMMRERLGDGYVEALRACYDDVPDTVDLVMYWWHRAALLTREGAVRRFGFITTNSLRQTFNRKVLEAHLGAKKDPARLVLAVPDHPWVDDGADVRISMTAAEVVPEGAAEGVVLAEVVDESGAHDEVVLAVRKVPVLHPDLKTGADVTSAVPLVANANVSFQGVNLVGQGFRVTPADFEALGVEQSSLPTWMKPYLNASEMMRTRQGRFVIDAFGHTREEFEVIAPAAYQWLRDRVKPERDQNNRKSYRDNWWIFAEARSGMRSAIASLDRYMITPRVSKHRALTWVASPTLPDCKLICIALDHWWQMGVLHSTAHSLFAIASGGFLERRSPNCAAGIDSMALL